MSINHTRALHLHQRTKNISKSLW